MTAIQGLKGTQDYWYASSHMWQHIEKIMISTAHSWGYTEVRTPIIEPEAVFLKIGQDTDIIGKEMYYLADTTEKTVLRPEGTSSILRSGLEHHRITRSTAKVWYMGPMFRHERPQKGRLRQFHQFGGEVFGYSSPEADVDLLDMLMTLMQALGIASDVQLEINTLGSNTSRTQYKKALVDYLTPLYDQLDADSKRRISTNPLRIFDSKIASTQALLLQAPTLYDFLTDAEKERHERICAQLDALGHSYTVNPRLVRGLDYYNDLVFEFTTTRLGAQGSICAGGRFDQLSEQWGSQPIPAVGFSIGMERVLGLLEHHVLPSPSGIIAFTTTPLAHLALMQVLKEIRTGYPGPVHYDLTEQSFKNKYKRALSGYPKAIITIEAEQYQENTCILRIPGAMPEILPLHAQRILEKCLTH